MPKISTYTSNNRLSTESPEVQRSTELAQASGKQISQVGDAISDVSLKYLEVKQKADRLRQKTEAQLFATEKLNSMKRQALEDNDLDGAEERYSKEFSRTRQEAGSLIKDPEARRQFEMEWATSSSDDLFQLQKSIFQRQQQVTVEARETAYSSLRDKVLNSNDKEAALELMRNHLNEDVSAGLKTGKQASDTFLKDSKDLAQKQVYHDLDVGGVEYAREGIKSNAQLSSEQRIKLGIALDKYEKFQAKSEDQMQKKLYSESVVNAAKEYLNGNLTAQNVNDMVINGALRPEDADAFLSGLFQVGELPTDKKGDAKASASAFVLMDMIDSGKYQDSELVMKAVEMHNKQELGKGDLGWILDAVRVKNQEPSAWKKAVDVMSAVKRNLGNRAIGEIMRVPNFFKDPVGTYQDFVKQSTLGLVDFENPPKYLMDGFGFIQKIMSGQESEDGK